MQRSARLLGIAIEDAGAEEIGRRARGTPRVANRLLRRDPRLRRGARRRPHHARGRRVRAAAAGGRRRSGWTPATAKILTTIIKRFDGGPVGIESLAASLAEDRDTLEFVYEPYLIQEGFLIRTPRGRQVTRRAYEHLGLPPPATSSAVAPAGHRCSSAPQARYLQPRSSGARRRSTASNSCGPARASAPPSSPCRR